MWQFASRGTALLIMGIGLAIALALAARLLATARQLEPSG
jgi:hypothetical protein